jgi:hypothetical protein
MLVVAGVALVCNAIAELPGGVYRLIPLIPVIGPLIGAGWAGRRYQPGSLDPISCALVGGAVQAMLMAMVLSVVLPNSPEFLFLPCCNQPSWSSYLWAPNLVWRVARSCPS